MLAYVFWHWPRPDVAISEYEARMRAFQDALAADGPRELRTARAWRIEGAPWLPGGAGYAEWYLLDDSAALDTLNRGAVTGPLAEPHNTVAALAAGGAAGLYQTASTNPGILDGTTASWFSKPASMPYADFYAQLGEAQSRLWRRMMVLGPTPEFCLLSDEADSVMAAAGQPITVQRELVWPTPTHP